MSQKLWYNDLTNWHDRKTYILSKVLVIIKYKITKLDELKVEVIKSNISEEKYESYNDETYKEKDLRKDIIMKHKKKDLIDNMKVKQK